MTREEIANYLAPFGKPDIYGNQSFVGQYRSANNQLGMLKDLYDTVADDGISADDYNLFKSALRGQRGSAIAGGIVSGLSGATSLLSNAYQSAQIADTSAYEGQIDDLSRAGNYNFNNYAQLANAYDQTNFDPSFNMSEIRGMTDLQKAGAVGSAALTGAATGMQIGGPWGAAIGGAIGLGTGIWGVVAGNKNAESRQNYLTASAQQASEAAQANYDAANERIRYNSNRQNAVNVASYGGSIRKQSLKEYADKVLRRPVRSNEPAPAKIVRSKGEGGTIVRIRVK